MQEALIRKKIVRTKIQGKDAKRGQEVVTVELLCLSQILSPNSESPCVYTENLSVAEKGMKTQSRF